MPKLVIIESPYAGDWVRHLSYLQLCVQDSFSRGEAPFASHGLYPRFLDDNDPEQRKQGLRAGFEIMRRADLVAVYLDLGISGGMREGITFAEKRNVPIVMRYLLDQDRKNVDPYGPGNSEVKP